jgi:membrane protease YdiL (CAAX protease family)
MRAETLQEPAVRTSRWKWWPYFVVGYVAVVLLVDALATVPARIPSAFPAELGMRETIVGAINRVSPLPMSSFQWRTRDVTQALAHTPLPTFTYRWMEYRVFDRFDVFKFVFWFLVPLALCGRNVDLKAFTTARWRKLDWYLFAGFGAIGLLVVFLVPFIPGVREHYAANTAGIPFGQKIFGFTQYLFWIFSWLLGWEFMHRYFLLQNVAPTWRKYGWLLVPFFEWAYHLQKHFIEAAGMAIFSLALTWYVIKRRNVSLPFLVHLLIEIALPLTVLFSVLNPLFLLLD